MFMTHQDIWAAVILAMLGLLVATLSTNSVRLYQVHLWTSLLLAVGIAIWLVRLWVR